MSTIYRTVNFSKFLGIQACDNEVAFCFWDLFLHIRNNLICIITRKSLYIQTDLAIDKVEADYLVKAYKAADALVLIFARNAVDRLNHKFNLPEANVLFHKEIKFQRSNLLRLQILP